MNSYTDLLNSFIINYCDCTVQRRYVNCGSGVARRGAAAPWCHHFGLTPFYDTNGTKKKTTIRLIPLEMFSTLEWTKKMI